VTPLLNLIKIYYFVYKGDTDELIEWWSYKPRFLFLKQNKLKLKEGHLSIKMQVNPAHINMCSKRPRSYSTNLISFYPFWSFIVPKQYKLLKVWKVMRNTAWPTFHPTWWSSHFSILTTFHNLIQPPTHHFQNLPSQSPLHCVWDIQIERGRLVKIKFWVNECQDWHTWSIQSLQTGLKNKKKKKKKTGKLLTQGPSMDSAFFITEKMFTIMATLNTSYVPFCNTSRHTKTGVWLIVDTFLNCTGIYHWWSWMVKERESGHDLFY
jgi:hypothetical protein